MALFFFIRFGLPVNGSNKDGVYLLIRMLDELKLIYDYPKYQHNANKNDIIDLKMLTLSIIL